MKVEIIPFLTDVLLTEALQLMYKNGKKIY